MTTGSGDWIDPRSGCLFRRARYRESLWEGGQRMFVLVIGARGQLARRLAQSEDALGFKVRALGRENVDLSKRGAATHAIASLRPLAVINAAAFTAVDKAEAERELAEAVNAAGPAELAAACAAQGIPLAHVSTDYVFDGAKGAPYVEVDQPRPINHYGATKLAGEGAVLAYERGCVLRTSWVYGAEGDSFLMRMLLAGAVEQSVRLVTDQLNRPTEVGDLAKACLTFVRMLLDGETNARGLFHAAGAEDATRHSWIAAAYAEAERCGARTCPIEPILSDDFPATAPRPKDTRMDSGKAAMLGVQLRGWREALGPVIQQICRRSQV